VTISSGGDQYDVSDEGERREQESFFNWFYLSINVSAAIAFGYLVTLATNGSGAIPQEWGFTAAYAIAAVAMSLAVLAFFAGRGRYIIKLPGGDVLAGLVTYIVASARQSWRGSLSLLGWILLVVFLILAIVQAFITDEALAHIVSYVALGVAVLCNGLLVATHTTNTHLEGLPESKWLTVEEAKGALDTVPILIVVNVSFSILYNLMPAAFVAQACQMNLSIGSSQINGAFFNIADCFAILIFVPIFEWVLFPAVRFLKGGKDITRSEKLVSGLVMSIAGVMCAVGLEYARRSSPDTGIVSNCAPAGVTMSSLSAFTMMAPFAIVGIGEVLINPVLYYFAYNQAPVRTRSMMQAFNLLCCGAISNAYTAALTTSMTVWFTDDLNNGHLDYFYFANAIIGAMGIPLFFFVSRYYVEKDWESTGKLEAGKAEAPNGATSNKVVDASEISIGSRGLVTFRSMVSRDV
jgi:dipeptide/tripeptide permease